MHFIGYCNAAPTKNKCAAFDRKLSHSIQIPVNKNGAIITGQNLNGKKLYENCLTVIDFDVRPEKELYVDDLAAIFNDTMLISTGGGGIHAYFLITDGIVSNESHKNPKLNCLKGIDIRGEGGIIFAPGCKFTDHQNGYALLNNYKPFKISKSDFDDIMKDLLKFEPKPLSFTGIRRGFIDIIEGKYKVPHIKDENTGVDEQKIWKAFYRELHNCKLDRNNVWSIWNRDPEIQPEFNQKTAEYQIGKIRDDYLNKRPTKIFYETIFPQYKILVLPMAKTKEDKEDKIPWYFEFETYWDENFASVMLWIDDWHKWVRYNNKGFFEPISDLEFDKIIFEWLEIKNYKLSIPKVNLAKKKIVSGHYTILNMYDADLNIRNVKNGLLYLDELILHEHTPDYLSLCQANVDYLEPQDLKPTPCWDEIKAKYPINIQKVEWYLKCIIFNNMSNELALFIVGVNRSSKGSTIGVISEMFPDSLTSHQSLELLDKSFGLSPLVGKNLNLDSEGTITRLKPSSIKYFKTIVGRDGKITVNIKGVKQFDHDFNPFFFLFAMNQLYRLPGTDLTAFFSRVFIAEFSKQETKPDPTFKIRLRKEADSIFSKLTHEGYETFILFYERIWGKKYILKNFINEMALTWESWSSPISIVCKDLFVKDEGINRMDVDETADLVTDGLAEHGYGIPANNAVKAQITKAFKRMGIKKTHSNKQYFYQPVRLIDDTMEIPSPKKEINKKKSDTPEKQSLVKYTEDLKRDERELNDALKEIKEEKEEKKPEKQNPRYQKIILEQLKSLHQTYGKEVLFDREDILEPIFTQISTEEFQNGIRELVKAGKIEVSEFGIRLGSPKGSKF